MIDRSQVLKPRLAVVSYLAFEERSPRGLRTRALASALEADWVVELVSGPPPKRATTRVRSSKPRRALASLSSSVLLDKVELWSKRRFRFWRPHVDAAVLIGYPFSPLVEAARRLRLYGIPYIVDAGDPWAITACRPLVRRLALGRAKRAEQELWGHAAGAILTTNGQAEALSRLFPALPVLVRPNGFEPSGPLAHRHARQTPHPQRGDLRLAHFGNLYRDRVDAKSFLEKLSSSKLWRRVEFHQFGADWPGMLRHAPQGAVVSYQEPREWSEVVELAAGFDAAVVVGNKDQSQLPSKVISYLTLPIPRIALCSDPSADAIGKYLVGKSGWLAVAPDDPDLARRVCRHVGRVWTVQELEPPDSESWDTVSGEIANFVQAVLGPSVTAPDAMPRRPAEVVVRE